MDKHFDSAIASTKVVYDADNKKHIRVFFEGSEYFEDIDAEIYEEWKDATGNYDKK